MNMLSSPMTWDNSAPWNFDVEGNETLAFINIDTPIIRVEAGPGTGKTFGLIRRVQRIVHPDGLNVDGSEVLVVAFNRVIARELKGSILKRLEGLSSKSEPVIRTIHSLCLRVLGDDIRLIMDHERTLMLFDVRVIYPELIKEYKDLHELAQALRDHEAGHRLHPKLWHAAQEWMARHDCRSINEMPSLVTDHLRGGDFQDVRFSHVVIDEFQDLTYTERELLFRMLRETGSLVVLGDTRQSIYAFRGNIRDGFAKLEQHPLVINRTIVDFPNYHNRRCPRAIVEAANNLMSLSSSRPMSAASDAAASLHIVTWSTPTAEARGMARTLRDSVRRHPDQRHLVLVTRRALGFMLQDELTTLDPAIAVHVVFSESILERWPAREAFLLFCLLADPDPATWRSWFGYQVPPARSAKPTFRPSNRNASGYVLLLDAEDDRITEESVRRLVMEPRSKSRGQGGTNIWDRAHRYITLKNALGGDVESATSVIETVFDSQWWKDTQTLTREDKLDLRILKNAALGLLAEIADSDDRMNESETDLRKVARNLRQQIATREPFVIADKIDVPIYTLYGSKGLTADHVFVLGVCDEAIPGEYDDSYPGTEAEFIAEQRRLMYVTITRSRRSLVISRPLKVKVGEARRLGLARRRTSGNWMELKMSQYMRSILSWLPDAVDGESWQGIE